MLKKETPGPARPPWQAEELGLPPEGKVGVEGVVWDTEVFEIGKQPGSTGERGLAVSRVNRRVGGQLGLRGREEQKATRRRWDPVPVPRAPRGEPQGVWAEERKAGESDEHLEASGLH